MNSIDSSLLAQIFFGISLVIFLVTLYIILPGFMYKKRTVLRPKLINAMWHRFYDVSIGKLKNSWRELKKKGLKRKSMFTYLPLRVQNRR